LNAKHARFLACGGLAAALFAAGCRQDMHDQPRFKPYAKSDFYADQRSARPLVEDTVFHLPFLGPIMNRIGGVRADPENAERLLMKDELVAVFPEGEKGMGKLWKDRYRLQRFGRGGFVKLALRTNAPIIPVAVEGTEGFPTLNPARWRKPGVRIRFGRLFRFQESGGRAPRDLLHAMTEDAMYRLAEILPPERRGFYSDLSQAKGGTIAPDAG
jgi:1-acyl-sn-glycerol-3-phosphate acyltransferase